MVIADRAGLPIALSTRSAQLAEPHLVGEVIAGRFPVGLPENLIGDKAYDSDPLDRACRAGGVTLLAPHRRNRQKPPSQEGRPLRRYRRRWKVERLFAWLQSYRRRLIRFEYSMENFLAFLHLAAFLILAKKYL